MLEGNILSRSRLGGLMKCYFEKRPKNGRFEFWDFTGFTYVQKCVFLAVIELFTRTGLVVLFVLVLTLLECQGKHFVLL